MKFSEKHDVIMTQFSQAVSLVVSPEKNRQNPHLKNHYSDLNSVKAAITHSLEFHGLTVMQEPSYREGQARDVLLMETTIIHATSQQWMTSMCQIPMQKIDPQGFGSTLSYARRYALMAIFSLNTADDDGNKAVKTQQMWQRDIEQVESKDDLSGIMKAIKDTGDAALLRVMQAVASKRKAELEVSQAQPFAGPTGKREKISNPKTETDAPNNEEF